MRPEYWAFGGLRGRQPVVEQFALANGTREARRPWRRDYYFRGIVDDEGCFRLPLREERDMRCKETWRPPDIRVSLTRVVLAK